MNKRKLKRKNTLKKNKGKQPIQADIRADKMAVTKKARETANHAIAGKPTLDCLGNFIFFSSESGEAWMLDHRDNLALRLADKYQILPYKIIETSKRFAVEWKERFQIKNEEFIAKRDNKQSVFNDYPTKTIEGLIEILTKK